LTSFWREKKLELSDRSDVAFKLDPNGPVDAVCKIDKKELARALSNLVNNAVEALEQNGGSVSLAVRDAMGEIAIIVSDDGRGIPQELLQRLGTDRVSIGKSGKSGSGLGIRHARTVTEGMRGRLSIQSRVGKGTLVTMIFPVEKVDAPAGV
jgi:signal transduction histidine kinase